MTESAIIRHGTACTYISKTTGEYDIETGTVLNAEKEYTVKIYKKHIKANQYNFPNLIGKDIALFYIGALNIKFKPQVQDIIVFDSVSYKVDSIQAHSANGAVVLYRVVGVV